MNSDNQQFTKKGNVKVIVMIINAEKKYLYTVFNKPHQSRGHFFLTDQLCVYEKTEVCLNCENNGFFGISPVFPSKIARKMHFSQLTPRKL